MFIRNIALCVIILCVVSLCVGLPFAEAHHGTDVENNALITAERNLTTAYNRKADWYRAYNNADSIVSTLLGQLLLIFSLCSLTSIAQLPTRIERLQGLLDSTEYTGSISTC